MNKLILATVISISVIAGILGIQSAKASYNYVTITPRVYLGGCYDSVSGLMRDSLRIKGLIPLSEPYTYMGYVPISEANNETIDTLALNVKGDSSIVDWVMVELRNTLNTVVANRRGLLLRNGYVVDIDGVSPLAFITIPQDNYFVSIKHRNHLPVMTQQAMYLTNETLVDFNNVPIYLKPNVINQPFKMVGNVRVLWSGDANRNRAVKYNGSNNDKDVINVSLGGNLFLEGYRNEDVNLDGLIKYNGVNNDREIILNNCILSGGTPNGVIIAHIPN